MKLKMINYFRTHGESDATDAYVDMAGGASGGINSTSLGRSTTRTRNEATADELFKKNKEGYLLGSLACVLYVGLDGGAPGGRVAADACGAGKQRSEI